jgi:hypothetical protein
MIKKRNPDYEKDGSQQVFISDPAGEKLHKNGFRFKNKILSRKPHELLIIMFLGKCIALHQPLG